MIYKITLSFLIFVSVTTYADDKFIKKVSSWEDWELCENLADYTFNTESKGIWYVTAEIEKRNLQNSARCEAVYNARMKHFYRKYPDQNTIVIRYGEAIGIHNSFKESTE